MLSKKNIFLKMLKTKNKFNIEVSNEKIKTIFEHC